MTRAALQDAQGHSENDIAIKPISTSGDKIQDRSLLAAGGKGLFTKEIEEELLAGSIDIAVHSAKDMPAELPQGLDLFACLPREDARDCLIGCTLKGLPPGTKIGTSSPRRAALMKRLRPDLNIVDFRGNVETRLAKIARGDVHASLLALAGLKRIGLEQSASEIMPIDSFPPAVGQGIIVIETRRDDVRIKEMLATFSHAPSMIALEAERAFLKCLDGSCRTPIAGYASIENDRLHFHGMILKPDGSLVFETTREGFPSDAHFLGQDAAQELKTRAPADFFS